MSILVGMLAKQIMRQAERSAEAGKEKYKQLFIETEQYSDKRTQVDNLLVKCGYEEVLSKN